MALAGDMEMYIYMMFQAVMFQAIMFPAMTFTATLQNSYKKIIAEIGIAFCFRKIG